MKKHILKLSLIALLGFGLFACGNYNTSSTSTTPASSNTESSTSSSSTASSSSSSSKASSSSSSSSSSSVAEEVKLSKVSEIKTIAKGTKVKFRATYQGKNNKVFKDSKLGDVWFGAYVADGDDWMQLFKTNKDLITNDINIGDVIEVEGTTAHYTNSNVTTPEVSATSIKKVTDATITAGNWLTFNETNHPALTNEMLNKGAHIENALVTNVNTSNSGNKTIDFKLVDTTYQIHLNKNYTDVTIDSIANLAENDTFSCDTYVSVNNGKYQFALANNFTSVKGEKVNVTGVTADAKISVNVGLTKKITASVEPSNATVKGLTYVSQNTEIATVDANGYVKGVAVGSTTVTVTSVDDTTKSATVNVTVVKAADTGNYRLISTHDFTTGTTSAEFNATSAKAAFARNMTGTDSINSITSVTKVYDGNGLGGAKDGQFGLIKFGTKDKNGSITIKFNTGVLVSKVVINCHSFYINDSNSTNTTDFVAVNDLTPVAAPYNATATPENVEFVIENGSNEVTIKSYNPKSTSKGGRFVAYSISFYSSKAKKD